MNEIKVSIFKNKAKIDCSEEIRNLIFQWMTLQPKAFTQKLSAKLTPVYFFSKRQGTINIGLVPYMISLVTSNLRLKKEEVEFKVIDKRADSPLEDISNVKEDMLMGIILRPSQIRAIKAMYTESHYSITGRGIISAFTGSGKTEIILAISLLSKKPVLIVAPDLGLSKQLYDRAQLRGLDVCQYSGQEDFVFEHKVTVTNIQMLAARLKKYKGIENSFTRYLLTVGCVLLDEVQNSSSQSCKDLLDRTTNCLHREGVSATPFKSSNLDDMRLMSEIGTIIAKIGAPEVIAEGAVSVPTFFYEEIPEVPNFEIQGYLSRQKPKIVEGKKVYKRYLNYADAYKVFIVQNKYRNNKIVEYVKKFSSSGMKTIVFVTFVDHGHILYDLIKKEGVSVKYVKGATTVENREGSKKLFEDGEADVLIATKVFDAGVDIAGGTNAVIMAGGGKSRVSLIQRTGRGTRLQHDGFNRVLVVDFDDTSKFVNKHSEQRKEYLQWFKFNIYEDPNYIEQFIEELKNWRLQNV